MPFNIVHVCFLFRFEAFVPNDDYEYAGDENTAIFNVASFQYIVLAIILSKSAPYRKTIFSNCK